MAVYNNTHDNLIVGICKKIESGLLTEGFAPDTIAKVSVELPSELFDVLCVPAQDGAFFTRIRTIKVRRGA